MTKHIQYLFYAGILCFGLSSCVSTKIDFKKEFEVDMGNAQNVFGDFNESAMRFVGVSEKTALGSFRSHRFTVVDMETGKVLYSKRASQMGDIGAIPADFTIDYDNKCMVIRTSSLTRNTLSVVDLDSGEERWNIRLGGLVSMTPFPGFDFSWLGAIPVHTRDEGLIMYDLQDGSTRWQLTEVAGINVTQAIRRGSSHFQYIPEYAGFMIAGNNVLAFVDAETGDLIWKIEGELGNLNEADFFLEDDIALFYGKQGGDAVKNLAMNTLAGSGMGGRIATRAIRASESGIKDNPLYYVDLKNGKIKWQREFKTSGQSYPILFEDKLILSDLFTYVIDRKSGKTVWQSVSEERLDDENRRRILSEFLPLSLDASNRAANDNVIVDDNIFIVHNEIFEEGGKKNQVSMRRVNIHTGEVIWSSEPERITITNFFFAEGKLFVQTSNRNMYRNGEIRAYDPGSGALLYEINANFSMNNPFITPYYIHVKDLSNRLYGYDVNTGELNQMNTPLPVTGRLEKAGNFLLGTFSHQFRKGTILAYVDPKTFEVERKVEIPFNARNRKQKGDYLYLFSDSQTEKSLLAVDFDRLETRGSLVISTQMKKVQTNPPTTLPDVHFYVTKNGENVYLTQKDQFMKYRIKD
ncbi:MAG: PQQ-binding-like beta-propeller repeat protein [Cyclobacteriaceae bacterium]|nr:PQQ-binding-like beta-propeller repeat protein [Cyclobacteriaceae bacterium]MCH8515471.1 PQQ-binding-like beta-propeller repeat protein [Cyclobacteriaceae bacterium]